MENRETAIDVVLQTTGAAFLTRSEHFEDSPPPEEDFQLYPNVTVGLLPDLASGDQVMDACRPTGFNFKPQTIYGYRYAFVRQADDVGIPSFEWDDDHLLGKILFLSRLVHPTTAAGSYSARLLIWNGELRQIIPGHTQGLGAYSYIVANEWRDWLTVSELEILRDALPSFLSQTSPERIRQGRRHIDHAFHGFHLDQRITSVVTGFESLLKVDRNIYQGSLRSVFRN